MISSQYLHCLFITLGKIICITPLGIFRNQDKIQWAIKVLGHPRRKQTLFSTSNGWVGPMLPEGMLQFSQVYLYELADHLVMNFKQAEAHRSGLYSLLSISIISIIAIINGDASAMCVWFRIDWDDMREFIGSNLNPASKLCFTNYEPLKLS